MRGNASSISTPASVSVRRAATPAASAAPSSWESLPPARGTAGRRRRRCAADGWLAAAAGVLDEGVEVGLLERGPPLGAVEQRVVAERAGDRAGAGLLGEAQQRRGRVGGVAAGLEGDRGEVDEDALEQPVEQRVDRWPAGVAEHEPERRDAVLQLGHEDVVGLGDVDVGGNAWRWRTCHPRRPAPSGRAPRTNGEQPGHAGVDVRRVLGGVEPGDRDAVVGHRGQRGLGLLGRHLVARLRQHAGDELRHCARVGSSNSAASVSSSGASSSSVPPEVMPGIVEPTRPTASPPCDTPPLRCALVRA